MVGSMKLSAQLRSELLRFLVVGGIAGALDAVLYAAFVHWSGVSPTWAKRLSFGIGSLWPFFANKYFTFGVRGLRLSEPVLFGLVYFIGWALNSLTHDFVLRWLGYKTVAFLAATGVSTCSNFVGMKFLVFRRKDSGTST